METMQHMKFNSIGIRDYLLEWHLHYFVIPECNVSYLVAIKLIRHDVISRSCSNYTVVYIYTLNVNFDPSMTSYKSNNRGERW